MINKEIKYIEILKMFEESNFKEVEKRFGYRNVFCIVVSLFVIIALIITFYYINFFIIVILVFLFILIPLLLFYIHIMNKKIVEYFGEEYIYFIKRYRLFWNGARALIFFEKLKEKKYFSIDEKKISKLIDIESGTKKSNDFIVNILVPALVTITISIVGILLDKIQISLSLIVLLLFIFWYKEMAPKKLKKNKKVIGNK